MTYWCLRCHHPEEAHGTREDGSVGSCTVCDCDEMVWGLR